MEDWDAKIKEVNWNSKSLKSITTGQNFKSETANGTSKFKSETGNGTKF